MDVLDIRKIRGFMGTNYDYSIFVCRVELNFDCLFSVIECVQ